MRYRDQVKLCTSTWFDIVTKETFVFIGIPTFVRLEKSNCACAKAWDVAKLDCTQYAKDSRFVVSWTWDTESVPRMLMLFDRSAALELRDATSGYRSGVRLRNPLVGVSMLENGTVSAKSSAALITAIP